MAGQAEGEAPNPLHSRTGMPLPRVDQALMSVPSELVTCCEVNGEEVRAIEYTPHRRSGTDPDAPGSFSGVLRGYGSPTSRRPMRGQM